MAALKPSMGAAKSFYKMKRIPLSPLFCLLVVALLAQRTFSAPMDGLSASHGRQAGGSDSLPNMVLIPAGEFWMGRVHFWLVDEIGWVERDRMDNQPAHLVYLDAYYIDKYEISNEEYFRFTEATKHPKPYHWIGARPSEAQEKMPVYNVTWSDAEGYCRWAVKRLPTEAEWERAARGGLEKKLFPWGDEIGGQRRRGTEEYNVENVKRAHVALPNGPAPVGSYPPNGFGLHDMTGNLWEWVSDWYERNYYSISPERNPRGPDTGVYRVIRGGSWSDSDERILSVHYRNYTDASVRTPTIGFRCAKSP